MVSIAGQATGPDRGGPGGLRSTHAYRPEIWTSICRTSVSTTVTAVESGMCAEAYPLIMPAS
jgi:hypothetical protein